MPSFDEATAVRKTGPHTYEGYFHEDWTIGSVPHGGYVTSTFMRVARAHFGTELERQNQPDTISLHLEFLRRTEVGPTTFKVKEVKLGRQASVIHVTLWQGEREEVLGYITSSNLATETGHSFETGWQLHPQRPPVDLARLRVNTDEQWQRQDAMPFPQFRKASQKVHFHFPRNGQILKSMVDQWISLKSGERFTNETLGFVSDIFPQIIESYRFGEDPYAIVYSEQQYQGRNSNDETKEFDMLWYPTMLLNLEVKKALPSDGEEFLAVRTRAKAIANGRMDLEVVILDARGDIVALSHHVVLIVSAKRNTAKRRRIDTPGSVYKDSKL